MKKVIVVFGTRAEAIKMCPLVKELKRRVARRSAKTTHFAKSDSHQIT